ncbi:protein of unknown function DUF45 [Desulfovibrio sp. X2]|uniref:M48 family metallopeptidase n=1 Tax=Desulfovibrio sp. X2 TaxID=941449 RepID=UPI0003588E11|nr:SprT family zinc-dependent metalloprotease [Desulfovibrio sp. X2]EPR41929.1 protein of unknown function DUF45 [Desulfovibrio sp. X2]
MHPDFPNSPVFPDTQGSAAALPPFTLKISRRARRMSLRLSMRDGLCVVAPPGVDRRLAARLVAERADWIARAAARLEARHGRAPGEPPPMPEALELRACAETLAVARCPSPGALRLHASPGRLLLAGEGDAAAVRETLLSFVRRRAAGHLPPLLRGLADEAGEEVGRIVIRDQKTRWGSCSARATISLNCRLLFLPPHLARYVLFHELAHLRRLDHSPAFWRRVAELDPAWRDHERELSTAGRLVPALLA